ncbi:MAG: nucleotide exchange factor GrpE [Candidatus Tectomicrobia bacterium]|nr:nucleotide exchange factor GrpE [Candidatus Tectomicrobia bacterium]
MSEDRTEEARDLSETAERPKEETAPASGAGEAPESPAQAPGTLESPQRELDELRDRHLRLLAEFDNFRKRAAREQQEIRERAGERVIADLLPVLDGIERAGDSIPAEGESGAAVKEGIELVLKAFREVLARHGLQEIQALAQPFDPNLHEAVMVVETADHPGDTVIEEVQKGYSLGGRVLRPSRVVVAKPLPREEE